MKNTINRKHLYENVYESIRNDIFNGKFKKGERLPSKRSMAEMYEVSVITIENALSQLIDEGYINSVERSGYYVCCDGELMRPKHMGILKNEVSETESKVSRSGNLFPFTVWSKIMRSVLSERDSKLLSPVGWCGVMELRNAISQYLFRCRNMYINPEQIIIGSGAEYFYNLIIQLLGRDLCYATENPCYDKIPQIYDLNNVNHVNIGQDNHGILTDELIKSGADVVHISPAHQFPTGIIMPVSRRQEIIEWAADGNRYIIEDDYDSEFCRISRMMPTIFGIDGSCRTIYINTFSQTLAPSVRISYMCLPPELISEWHTKMKFYSCPVPAFEQYTLAKFISGGYFERHINRMRKYYRNTVEDVKKFLSSYNAEIHDSDAGLHFIVTIKNDAERIISDAKNHGIVIRRMDNYYRGINLKYHDKYIVNYANAFME